MRVKEIMTKNIKMISIDASLKEAARQMRKSEIGGMPVLDNDRMVGFVTDRDIVMRAVAEGLEPEETSVKQVMTRDVLHLGPEDSIEAAASAMKAFKVRRLVVLEPSRKVAGIVTLGDLAIRGRDEATAGTVLGEVTKMGQRRFRTTRPPQDD